MNLNLPANIVIVKYCARISVKSLCVMLESQNVISKLSQSVLLQALTHASLNMFKYVALFTCTIGSNQFGCTCGIKQCFFVRIAQIKKLYSGLKYFTACSFNICHVALDIGYLFVTTPGCFADKKSLKWVRRNSIV